MGYEHLPPDIAEMVRRVNASGIQSYELALARGRERPDHEPDPHDAVVTDRPILRE
jgi:hypothetical protein